MTKSAKINEKIGKKLQNLYSIAEHIFWSDILQETLWKQICRLVIKNLKANSLFGMSVL